MKPEEKQIAQVIQEINNGKIIIPEFQREYVWTKDQVKDLLESLLKGYPIGTITIWRTDENKHRRNEKNYRQDLHHQYYDYIVDGQQRMTALNLLFRGNVKYYDDDEISTAQKPNNLYVYVLGKPRKSEGRPYTPLIKFLDSDKKSKDPKEKLGWYRISKLGENTEEFNDFIKEKTNKFSTTFKKQATQIVSQLKNFRDQLLDCEKFQPEWVEKINRKHEKTLQHTLKKLFTERGIFYVSKIKEGNGLLIYPNPRDILPYDYYKKAFRLHIKQEEVHQLFSEDKKRLLEEKVGNFWEEKIIKWLKEDTELLDVFKDESELKNRIKGNLDMVFECYFDTINQNILMRGDKPFNFDEIVEIFDFMNTKGTKLNITTILRTYLIAEWPPFRKKTVELLDELEGKGFHLSDDLITRIFLTMFFRNGKMSDKQSELKNKIAKLKKKEEANEENTNANDIEAEFSRIFVKIKKYLLSVINIISTNGFQDDALVSSYNVFVIPVFYMFHRGHRGDTSIDNQKFMWWFHLALIRKRYGGQSDTKLEEDIKTVQKDGDVWEALVKNIESDQKTKEIEQKDFESTKEGIFLHLTAMYNKEQNFQDFYATTPFSYKDSKRSFKNWDKHHIIPKAFLEAHAITKEEINCIANKTWLTPETNKIISDSHPGYLSDDESEWPESKGKKKQKYEIISADIKNKHCIPTDLDFSIFKKKPLLNDEVQEWFGDFIENRSKLLKEKMNVYLNKLKTGGVENSKKNDPLSEEEINKKFVWIKEKHQKIEEYKKEHPEEHPEKVRKSFEVERPQLELKESYNASDSYDGRFAILKEIAAFLNISWNKKNQYSYLIIGVSDIGDLKGINFDNEKQKNVDALMADLWAYIKSELNKSENPNYLSIMNLINIKEYKTDSKYFVVCAIEPVARRSEDTNTFPDNTYPVFLNKKEKNKEEVPTVFHREKDNGAHPVKSPRELIKLKEKAMRNFNE